MLFSYTLRSALLISDLGIYFSNPRTTYIEQVFLGERRVENETCSVALNLRSPVRILL